MLQKAYEFISRVLDLSEFAIAKFSPGTPTKVVYLHDYTPYQGPVWTIHQSNARLFYDINDIEMNFPLYDKSIHLAFSWLDNWGEEDILKELNVDSNSMVYGWRSIAYDMFDLPEIAIASYDTTRDCLLYLSNPQQNAISWTTDREEAYLFYDFNDAKRIFKPFNPKLHVMFTWLDDWEDTELKRQFTNKY
jgi:hypothetical protein